MATLIVNGEDYEVIGGAGYSTATIEVPVGGVFSKAMPVAPYIEATIRIGADQRSVFEPPSDVRLTTDGGTVVSGSGMWDTASGAVNGDVRRVRFEGVAVEEE